MIFPLQNSKNLNIYVRPEAIEEAAESESESARQNYTLLEQKGMVFDIFINC